MKEQSHKHEMGAALRGDFERLRARRGESDAVLSTTPPPPEAILVAPPPASPVAAVATSMPPAANGTPAPAPRTTWLERLLGRG